MVLDLLTPSNVGIWFVYMLIWLFCQWRVHCIILRRWESKQRKNVVRAKSRKWLGELFSSFRYRRKEIGILLENYKLSVPYGIQVGKQCWVQFSSDEHIDALGSISMQRLPVHTTFRDIIEVGVGISAPNPGRHKAGAENTILYCLGPFLHQYQPDGYKQLSGTISVIKNRLKLSSALADAPGRSTTTRDYLHYIIDSTIDYGHFTTEDIVLTVLMTWLIAVHETAVIGTHALENLCKYPDYAELIRSEVIAIHTLGERRDSYHDSDLNPSKLDQCPVLDAFLKETCRLAPPNAITMQRKARSAITFKDGTRILPGDLACVPSQAIMRDENFYQDSMSFFPRRFLDHGSQSPPLSRNLRFTGTENTYPLWGLGKHACPGRFYASAALKLFVAHALRDYDMKLPPQVEPRTYNFYSFLVPKAESYISLRKRNRN